MSLMDTLAGTLNLQQPLPWLVTCGQPSLAQLEAAAGAGVTAVIDLRDPMEARPFDEPATAARLGISYHVIPVQPGALTDAALEQIVAVLRERTGQLTMLHCASANRVGGALIAHLMLDQGMDEATAVETAMRVGLRSAELMEWGTDYARRHAR